MSEPNPVRAGGFDSVDEVIAKLQLNADAARVFDDFLRTGGGIEVVADSYSGAYFGPVETVIGLDPAKITDLDDATSALLYELLRFASAAEQLELDRQAKVAALTRDEYATRCEQITYHYMRAHSVIARKSIPADWPAATDTSGKLLAPGGLYESLDRYLDRAKADGHFAVFERRYNSLAP